MTGQAKETAYAHCPEVERTLVGSRTVTMIGVTAGRQKVVQDEAGEEAIVQIGAGEK